MTSWLQEFGGAENDPLSRTVQVRYTFPGRAPVALGEAGELLVCPDRGGMSLQVLRSREGRLRTVQTLSKHDMIVNAVLLAGPATILSAGWDSQLVCWVSCHCHCGLTSWPCCRRGARRKITATATRCGLSPT